MTNERKNKLRRDVEILAPAGSMESMTAAICAGADAVYMGGSRFGARAYAENPEEDGFLKAIDYAHLHGCKLYMTTNTLVKEREMEAFLDFLMPYYEQGLDGAIVQDLGVLSMIREYFPELPIHVSTQMTVTGYRMAGMMKDLGAVRVVTARELSLEEIKEIKTQADIEIESFVHGALCYCYSGQCLMSSLIGGRSGNRGRCAQPCRLPYRAGQMKDAYLLNLKDLCVLDILPDILEAGVYSLKIEGRMKSPRYTAGVVSVYRKYVDRYLEYGREGYGVEDKDRKMLLELFDRGGFTEGYYQKHNGKDMIALGEKPGIRRVDSGLFEYLDREFVEKKKKEPVRGKILVREGEPARFFVEMGDGECRVQASVTGAVVQTAKNQPVTKERLLKQMNKTGDSPFYFQELEAEVWGNCFLPVQDWNGLRRRGLEALEQEILKPYRRKGIVREKAETKGNREKGADENGRMRLHVSLEEPDGLMTVLACKDADQVYLDSCGFGADSWREAADACHKAEKQCALIMPHIFRKNAQQYFKNHMQKLKEAGFDEVIVRSLEQVGFLKEQGVDLPMVFDANLYGMNQRACRVMEKMGAARLTLPFELNERELLELGCEGKELVAYGYLPAMVSAQCVQKTVKGCSRRPGVMTMRDRTGKQIPVKNHCRFCYNVVYNPAPLCLWGLRDQVRRLKVSVLRLSFTMETPGQIKKVLKGYGDYFLREQEGTMPCKDFTRGHFKRGVE